MTNYLTDRSLFKERLCRFKAWPCLVKSHSSELRTHASAGRAQGFGHPALAEALPPGPSSKPRTARQTRILSSRSVASWGRLEPSHLSRPNGHTTRHTCKSEPALTWRTRFSRCPESPGSLGTEAPGTPGLGLFGTWTLLGLSKSQGAGHLPRPDALTAGPASKRT